MPAPFLHVAIKLKGASILFLNVFISEGLILAMVAA